MRQMLSRRFTTAFATALIASVLLVGTAQAGTKSISVVGLQGCYKNNLGLCAWSSTANFFAKWGVSAQHSEGQSYWTFTNFQLDSVVINGKQCSIGGKGCTSWTWFANVSFLNSSGGLVTRKFWSPTWGLCEAAAYSSSSIYFGGCARVFDIPASAVKMTIHWGVGMQCGTCGLQVPWSADRTVTIANT